VSADAGSLDALADAITHREALRAVASDLLGREWSTDRSRAALDRERPSWPEALWSVAADVGWPELLVAEPAGGGGVVGDLCALTEATGASLAPIPLASTAVAAWLMGGAPSAPACLVTGSPATITTDGTSVSGSWPLVADAGAAGTLLVLAADGDHLSVVTVDRGSAGITPLRPLDRSPAAAVDLDGAAVGAVLAAGDEAAAVWQAAVDRLHVAWVSELVGVAAAANAAAAAYACERTTFGRPIGTYQAIKHRLVDDRAAIEVARALVDRAAGALQAAAPDGGAMTALAVFWALDALRAVPEHALQVFGGIGYTWEHDAHLHVRRAAVLASQLGSQATHRDRAAAWIEQR
jgi:alkylation response protein AidB-like acyl-CoA dehydrogenase